jgi:hypothetical protein
MAYEGRKLRERDPKKLVLLKKSLLGAFTRLSRGILLEVPGVRQLIVLIRWVVGRQELTGSQLVLG